MKNFKILFTASLLIFSIIFSSCGKGYEVRLTNYNTEVIDSLIIGKSDIVFAQTDRQATTEYKKISSGEKTIRCVTKTKKIYSSSISIPKRGTGKRTIQIDGLNRISVLED
jgi:hypothetical protein